MRDVHDMIAEQPNGFNAIPLDVDNSLDGLVGPPSERLHCDLRLPSARAVPRPGGVLSIWSIHPDDVFTDRLGRARSRVEEVGVGMASDEKDCCHDLAMAGLT